MKTFWSLGIIACVLASFCLTGCDKAPKDLPSTFKPGKCVVCGKKTKVQEIPVNPGINYSVKLCWKPECEQEFAANRGKYVDAAKEPNRAELGIPENTVVLPGANTPAPATR